MQGSGKLPECDKTWLISGHVLNCIFENNLQPPEKLFIVDAKGVHDYENYNNKKDLKMEQKITHPELVKALVKPGAAILETLTPEKCDLWHMITGVVGEVGELVDADIKDRENVIEELGDIEFYLEGIRQNLKLTYQEAKTFSPALSSGKSLTIETSQLLDLIKKFVIYNKPIQVDLISAKLYDIEQILAGLRHEFEITREETLDANIAKLSVRYKGIKYTDEAAQKREDKATHNED